MKIAVATWIGVAIWLMAGGLVVAVDRAPRVAARPAPVAPVLHCAEQIEVWIDPGGTTSARCALGRSTMPGVILHDSMRPERDAHGAIVPESFVGAWISYR